MRQRWWIVLWLVLAPLAQAASVHAFLNRNHVSLGDTVTLNIDSAGSLGTPDIAPLQKDFQVLGTSRSSRVRIVHGKATRTTQLGIALKPLHAGALPIPSFAVGSARTQPLVLHVGAAPSGGTGTVGDPAFMETSVLSSSPYVDAQTVYTVRLFYFPAVNGALGQPSAVGARLIRLDRDHRYTVDRDGYTYEVIARSWALIPGRSGSITVQGPTFQGQRMTPGNLGSWLNNPNALLNHPGLLLHGQVPGLGAPVHAAAPAIKIDVRPAPANAGKPWLPARAVRLQLTGLPADGKVTGGVPLTLTLSVSASGQPAGVLPEPQLPPITGARVYPDQTRDTTDDRSEWLQGTRTRSFAIVPERNGTLAIPKITLDWWDVVHRRREQATLAPHVLQVSGVAAAAPPSPGPAAAAVTAGRNAVPASAGSAAAVATKSGTAQPASTGPWRTIALASLVLWVLAAIAAGVGGWHWRRRVRGSAAGPGRPDGGRDASGAAGMRGASLATGTADPQQGNPRALHQRVLEAARAGDAAACEHALLAWARAARGTLGNVTMLRDALRDAAQRDALDALQRARWQGGDPAPACAATAQAFARGLVWDGGHEATRGPDSALPPLYPS